ncbi:MAG: hypothetical protein LBD53_10060 [Tannerella sp.]|nr:hypothetical protein [Tannerella sp.]
MGRHLFTPHTMMDRAFVIARALTNRAFVIAKECRRGKIISPRLRNS